MNNWILNYLDGALQFLQMTASVLDPGQGNKQPELNTVKLKLKTHTHVGKNSKILYF